MAFNQDQSLKSMGNLGLEKHNFVIHYESLDKLIIIVFREEKLFILILKEHLGQKD